METIGFVPGQSSTHKAPDTGKTLHRRFSNSHVGHRAVCQKMIEVICGGVYEERQCER